MNTPTSTPRADTEITFTGTYTCTHHNDQQRAACPVCLVAALTAERGQLRAVFPLICAAIGNGACCKNSVSLGFIQSIPNEVQLVVAELRARAERAEADLAALAQCHDDNCRAVVQLDAELAKERARLDWLEKSDPDALHWWTVGEPNSIRADIDVAMKESAPQLIAERTDAIYQRACEVEHELRAGLATEREKAERYRLTTLKLDAELAEMHNSFAGNVHMENRELRAELAAERARLDYLLQWDVTFHDRADIDAEIGYAQRKKRVPTLP
jgi:hypothetical protein